MRHSRIFLNTRNIGEQDTLSNFINNLDFIPNSFGHQYNNPLAVCEDRIIGDFEIIYVTAGESDVTIAGEEYICGSGDIVFIPPFTRHKIQTPAGNPHDNYWIHFEVFPIHRHEEFIAAMKSCSSYKTQILFPSEATYLYGLLESRTLQRLPGGISMLKTVLTQILVLTLGSKQEVSFIGNDSTGFNERGVEIIEKSTEFIYDHISQPISLNDLCRNLNISESCLYKTFMRALKITPVQYTNLCKIKRAEQLMISTRLSFNEISDQLGFSSPYYFSSVFKRFYKKSPREYLKSTLF